MNLSLSVHDQRRPGNGPVLSTQSAAKRNGTHVDQALAHLYHAFSRNNGSRNAARKKQLRLSARKKTPSGEAVPRLSEFDNIAEVIHCWRTGVVRRKDRQVRRVVAVPHTLTTVKGRKETFESEDSRYSNDWWRQCHKSALDRLRRVVICVASYGNIERINAAGDDDHWDRAIVAFHAANPNVNNSKCKGKNRF